MDAAGGTVDFFFRDDDVGWDDDRLSPLLDIFAELRLSVDLAVIPQAVDDTLARRLTARAESGCVRVHQHGFAHVNHEPLGRKYEFGPSRATLLQRRDIDEGRSRLEGHFGPLIEPIFTPPWNRCTQATGRCLIDLGFEVLSREARAPTLGLPGLVELPIRIDWFAHHRQVRLAPSELGELMAAAIRTSGPIGIMFHHAAMDRDDRRAAAELLALIADHHRARVHPMLTLARDRHAAPGVV
ncbi:MAG: hypothetical protein ACRDJV_07980 [Actinomycetota bacterium]